MREAVGKYIGKTILGLVFALLGTTACGHAIAKARVFIVTEVSGKVLCRYPSRTGWLPVAKGNKIPAGWLLQVTEGSQISINLDLASDSGYRAKELRLTIREPLIVRLSPELLRPVKLSPHFLGQLPDITSAQNFDESEKLRLKDAWERVAAVFTGRQVGPPQQDNDKFGMDVALRADEIPLLSPRPTELIYAEEYPADFKVVWRRRANYKGEYVVSMWSASAPKKHAVARTSKGFYTVPIPGAGLYFVQVESRDGRWQSRVHKINALPKRIGDLSESKEMQNDDQGPIRLRYPANNSILRTGAQGGVTFLWEQATTELSQKHTVLKIMSKGNNRIISKKATGQQVSMHLDPGLYVWWLESKDQGDKNPFQKSQANHFRIVASNKVRPADQLSLTLRHLLSQPENGQLIWD